MTSFNKNTTLRQTSINLRFLLLSALLFAACSKDHIPVVTEWIDLSSKQEAELEKTFRTTGKGVGSVNWWAGGYLWQGGSFTIELIDVKKKQAILKKVYAYGDSTTGKSEEPRFHWWHAEEKDRIILAAGRVYQMKLKTVGVAQPGAGWGLWLYPIGGTPLRHESPNRSRTP
jgi:hypothetical protein